MICFALTKDPQQDRYSVNQPLTSQGSVHMSSLRQPKFPTCLSLGAVQDFVITILICDYFLKFNVIF